MQNNKKPFNAVITALGMYVPEKVLDNKYFESILDTSDEWIMARTGIKERRILESGGTSVLATNAALDLIQKHNIDPLSIDVVIVATISPDYFFPSTSCIVQHNIGAKNAWTYDLSAACSGFVFALKTGASLIESGEYKKVLVIGADKMSSIADYTDRNTCILFGDAGAAVLLEPTEDKEYGIVDAVLKADGSGKDYLIMKGGGSANPSSVETINNKWHYIYQEGKAVFKFAVTGMAEVSLEIMQRNNLKSEDIAYLVPHQANLRIISATGEKMGLTEDKVLINIHKYGNTTAATIPMCLVEAYREGKIKKGDNLVLTAFGGGFTWGSIYLKWSME